MNDLITLQRSFFQTGQTLPPAFRKAALKRLRKGILEFEDKIKDALKQDLGKSASESYMTEIGMTLSELAYMEKNLARFAKKRRVKTPLAQFWASTYEIRSPYGVVLVMSPWNYPFMLALEPAIDAIAAGNTVVIKPSAYSPATSKVLAELIAATLPAGLATVVQGGREANKDLLDGDFDYIFFTGGKTVGREVMKKAAERLIPVSLELGGKSPCLVDASADLKIAARRIAFGKFLNCGQTCVAPDYVVIEESVRERFVRLLRAEIVAQYGKNPLQNPTYGKIVNRKHFDRLRALCPAAACDAETLKIAPTVVDGATADDPLMGEEIFGPLLPVLSVDKIANAKDIIARNKNPLALYLFTGRGKTKRDILNTVQFGGGCVNDTIIHLAGSETGFGGVGESGIGAYHGRAGFETFTHVKSIVDKKTCLDLPFRYQPYKSWKDRLIRLFMR